MGGAAVEILRILGVAAAISAFIIWYAARSEDWNAPGIAGLLVGVVGFLAGMVILKDYDLDGPLSIFPGLLRLLFIVAMTWVPGRATMLWLQDRQKKRSVSGR